MIKIYPEIKEICKMSEDKAVVKVVVSADCDFFKGHFDDVSIFPGVGQIDFAIKMASETFGIMKSEFQGLPQAKFKKVIIPNDELELHLTNKAATISFEYICGDVSMSSGNVKYA